MTRIFPTLHNQAWRLLAAGLVAAAAGALSLPADAAPFDHGPRGAMGAGPMTGGPMFGGARLDRMLDLVNATADQRAKIKAIADAARTDLQAQRQAARTLRDQMHQLFTQPTVDAAAAEALRQQMLAQHDQASRRMLQAMLDVSVVLTAEQRQQLAGLMAQRRAMWERHRAERQGPAPGSK